MNNKPTYFPEKQSVTTSNLTIFGRILFAFKPAKPMTV